MGTWSDGPFGNDGALDWLDGVGDARDADALTAWIREPLRAYGVFEAVGAPELDTSPHSVEAAVALYTSAARSAQDRAMAEYEIRSAIANPDVDLGAREAQTVYAAATFVCWRLGVPVVAPELAELRGRVVRDYAPPSALVAEVRAALDRIAGNPDMLAGEPRWPEKVLALQRALDSRSQV